MNEHDPYSAPLANLEAAPVPSPEGLLAEARRLPIDAGITWLTEGWRLFLQAPGTWIALVVVWLLAFLAVSFVPIVGGIAANLLAMLMMAGIALGCDELRQGGTLRVSHLFAPWDTPARTPLLLLGLFYMLGTMLVTMIVLVLGLMLFGSFALIFDGFQNEQAGAAMIPVVIGFVLVVIALSIPLGMAIWFAPPLIALNGVAPLDAMKSSFNACWKNFDVILVYVVATTIITILALLPLGLGLLVSSPMLMASSYAGYRQLYCEEQ